MHGRRHLLHRQPGHRPHGARLHPRLLDRPSRRPGRSAPTRACSWTSPSASRTTGRVSPPTSTPSSTGNYDGEYAPFTNVGRRSEHLGRLRLLRLLHRTAATSIASPTRGRSPTTAVISSSSRASTKRRSASPSGSAPTSARGRRSRATATPTPTAATSSSSPSAAPKAGSPRHYEADVHVGYPVRAREAGEAQHPARRLQPAQRAARGAARPALRLPGGGQLPARTLQSRLRTGGAAHTTDVGPAGVASELLTSRAQTLSSRTSSIADFMESASPTAREWRRASRARSWRRRSRRTSRTRRSTPS